MTPHSIRADTHTNTNRYTYMPIYVYVTMVNENIQNKCNG